MYETVNDLIFNYEPLCELLFDVYDISEQFCELLYE